MQRDAYSDFADSPGLREALAEALEERLDREAIDSDIPSLHGLFAYWRRQGCPQLTFRISRGATPATLDEVSRSARFVGFDADNDEAI